MGIISGVLLCFIGYFALEEKFCSSSYSRLVVSNGQEQKVTDVINFILKWSKCEANQILGIFSNKTRISEYLHT